MATQEERFSALEKNLSALQEKTNRSIIEIDENTTILLGVIRHQGQDIRRMSEHLNTLDQRLEQVETHLNQLETKIDEHTTLLTQILSRLPNNPK